MTSLQIGPIKDVALGIYDGPHATPKETDEGPIFLGIKNVTPRGGLDLSEIRHVSEEEYPKWTKRVVPREDDIVFSYEATLHRYALIPEGFRGCLGRRMALVRPDRTKVYPRFLHYYFLTPTWRAVVESNIISGATVDRVPLTRFPDFEVRMPHIAVQERIASTLSAYDDLIENNRRRIQLLEQAARLLYKEWFVHLRFPGHEHVTITNGVPEGWSEGVVADFYSTGSGGTPSRKTQEFYTGEIPWVKTQELTGGFILSTDERITDEAVKHSSAKLFPRHTVLIAMYGATIGQTAILSVPSTTNQACCAIIPKIAGTSYAHAYLFFCHHKTDLVGLGQGAAQNNVSQQVIRSFRMVLPHKRLLDAFSASASPIFEQIEMLQESNIKLSRARDLLLPRMMNGEVNL